MKNTKKSNAKCYPYGEDLPSDVKLIVFSIASAFRKRYPDIPMEDLSQEGMVSAMKAMESFDATCETKLTSWVAIVVRNDLRKVIEKHTLRRRTVAYDPAPERLDCAFISDDEELLDMKENMVVLRERLSPMAWKTFNHMMDSYPLYSTRKELAELFNIRPHWVDVCKAEVQREISELYE